MGSSKISRRDFLRLGGLLPMGLLSPRLGRTLSGAAAAQEAPQNVLILIFDALSALNLALEGYARETAPNLTRLAERAIVYHNHYATSNFTTSGTASILTGTLPWTNRAIQDNGKVAKELVDQNIFNVFSDCFRTATTHNPWAMRLLEQFQSSMEYVAPPHFWNLDSYDALIHKLFYRDDDAATVGWARTMKLEEGYGYSLLGSRLVGRLQEAAIADVAAGFPRGLPALGTEEPFLLEQATNWVAEHLQRIPQPFFTYAHFLPPHGPYRTSLEFYERFRKDGVRLPKKPRDEFGTSAEEGAGPIARTWYDEFILYADKSLGQLFEQLERTHLADNTWIVVTSDHGEIFERGLIGHRNFALYQPLVRVPLLIFEPGRDTRLDVHTPSSAIDLLPTLAQVTGHSIPSWAEGSVLAPFGESGSSPAGSVIAVMARESQKDAPLERGTLMLTDGRYKLIYYFGYVEREPDEWARLYDLEADPEELADISASEPRITARMLEELKGRLAEANRPYQA